MEAGSHHSRPALRLEVEHLPVINQTNAIEYGSSLRRLKLYRL